MDRAVEIPLQFWADPQGDSVVMYSARECLVFRGCWVVPGEPADFISCLSFHGVQAVHCFPREYLSNPHLTFALPSSVLSLSDSTLIQEHREFRQRHYPNAWFDPKLRHFIVRGHDFYHEILALGFTETAVQAGEILDPQLRQLLQEA